MADVLVPKIESPWARAIRSFLSALASNPVLIALVASFTTVQAVKEGLVPAAIGVCSALLVGLSALALGYSEKWRALTNSPFAKGLAQAAQLFAAGLLTVTIASLDPDVLVSVGDSILALLSASVLSGILTGALAAAQKPAAELVEA